MGINPEVNIIVQQEFELTYEDIVVQHINHNTEAPCCFAEGLSFVKCFKYLL